MGRHSSDIMAKLTVRVPRGHQGFWEEICKRVRFTVPELDYASCVDRKTVRDFVLRLERAEYIEVVDTQGVGQYATKVYELVHDQPDVPHLKRDGSPATPPGAAQDQMWRAMKMLAEFDYKTLSVAASTDTVPITGQAAKSYIKQLYRAQYLIQMSAARPPKTPATFRLGRNTGPLAPEVQRTKFIFDPNLKRVIQPQGGEA